MSVDRVNCWPAEWIDDCPPVIEPDPNECSPWHHRLDALAECPRGGRNGHRRARSRRRAATPRGRAVLREPGAPAPGEALLPVPFGRGEDLEGGALPR